MECVIISGTLSAKLRNKLFASFHKRFVELVFVENKDKSAKVRTSTTTCIVDDGYYELRLYKDSDKKCKRDMFALKIDPNSLECYVNYLNSNKHKFTFVCTSERNSICFSAISKYERDSWISVLEQLQWQFQPNVNLTTKSTNKTNEKSVSNSSSNSNHSRSADSGSSDDDMYMAAEEYNQYLSHKNEEKLKIIEEYVNRITNVNTNFDNNYYYNYYNSNLKNDACNTNGEGNNNNNRTTILGLLNHKYDDKCNTNGSKSKAKGKSAITDELQYLKSPKYGATKQMKCNADMNDIALKC